MIKLKKYKKLSIFLLITVILVSCFVVSSFAVSSDSIPTDLTGYTVTVPSGWTATAGYGRFLLERTDLYIDGDLSSVDIFSNTFWIGYGFNGEIFDFSVAADHIVFSSLPLVVDSSFTFSFTVTGGQDVANADLIQWLVDNNAVFEAPPPPPGVLDVILELFISVGQWVSGAASSLVAMFWTGEELTFVGFLAVGALAVSVVFLIIGFISRFIRFGG